MIGVPVSKDSLNAKIGANAQSLKKASIGLADLKDFGDAYTAQALVDAFGFSLEEANLFKSALAEVPSVTTVVDGLSFLSQAWGA